VSTTSPIRPAALSRRSSEGYAYLSSLENPLLRTYYFQIQKKF